MMKVNIMYDVKRITTYIYIYIYRLIKAREIQKHHIFKCDRPPRSQPGLWCQWGPRDDGAQILWVGSEKFYNYVDWLQRNGIVTLGR